MPHKLDVGCGPNKRPGYIGIDTPSRPGVDHVIDIEQERLPFPDASVSHVFASHCLEYLKYPMQLFREIARVAQDGAEVGIWTPYAFSNGAFLYSHLHFLAEDHYSHMCILFPEVYKSLTGAYWNWHDLTLCRFRTHGRRNQPGVRADRFCAEVLQECLPGVWHSGDGPKKFVGSR